MEDAIKESVRVLKAGGSFFCLYDFEPSCSLILDDVKRRGGRPMWMRGKGGFLSVETCEYVPPEKVEKWEMPHWKQHEEIAQALSGEKYGISIEARRYFTCRLIDLLRPHFDSAESGVNFGFFCGKKMDEQKAINIRGVADTPWRNMLAYYGNKLEDYLFPYAYRASSYVHRALEALLQPTQLSLEIVSIPYIMGKSKK